MTRIIDRDGRVFGRMNLVDALCVAFLAGLVPAAYSSWLLFHPAAPRIGSVEHSEITEAEMRVAAGRPIRMKVKVRGDHLTPMLRASIGRIPALGFEFEGPASGDVVIGTDVPPGTHDLVLYDGTREVARAKGAISIVPATQAVVRAVGGFTQMNRPTATSLHVGQRFEVAGQLSAEILALGPIEPDRRAIGSGTGHIDVTVSNAFRRDGVVAVHCDPDADASVCRINGTTLSESGGALVTMPGGTLQLRVEGIVPDASPRTSTLHVQVTGLAELATLVQAGDRDVRWPGIDERAASVSSVRHLGANGTMDVSIQLGLDRTSDGWRYHAQRVQPGDPFSFVTERYSLSGTVLSVTDAR